MDKKYHEGIGRRKESTARIRIMEGSGNFIVNEKNIEDYFTRLGDAPKFIGIMGSNLKCSDNFGCIAQSGEIIFNVFFIYNEVARSFHNRCV